MKKSNELYISDVTESEELSRKSGDAQAIIAEDEKEEEEIECEHPNKKDADGNQDAKYYECCEKEKVVEEKKIGNQSKEYYNE